MSLLWLQNWSLGLFSHVGLGKNADFWLCLRKLAYDGGFSDGSVRVAGFLKWVGWNRSLE